MFFHKKKGGFCVDKKIGVCYYYIWMFPAWVYCAHFRIIYGMLFNPGAYAARRKED